MLSSRARYALRALLDLSLLPPSGPVLVQDIADRQNIPVKFLQQIMLDLKQAGLLASRKGPGGGYLLAVAPGTITLADILQAVEGASLDLTCQKSDCGCPTPDGCAIYEAFCAATKQLNTALKQTTLADLRERQRELAIRDSELLDFTI